jgi:hypothetical protein
MKKLLLAILLSSSLLTAGSQQHENSWINYNQEYYKIKIAQNGINRISWQTLVFAGFSTSGVDPRKIQLFHNGEEQHIYVEGENDGVFDPSDFIEFYGERNDGSFDKSMYADSTWHPTPEYSLYTDTSVYFLTYSTISNGLRLTQLTDTAFGSYTPASYFIKETYLGGRDVPNFASIFGYNRGNNSESIDYSQSEGWGSVFGNYFGGNYPINIPVNTNKAFTSGPDAEVNVCLGGVNNKPHYLTLSFPGINHTDLFYYQELKKYNFPVSSTLLTSASSNFNLNVTTAIPNADYCMFYWLSLKYPHTYDLEGQNTFRLLVPDGNGKTLMEISNFNGGSAPPLLYDITNHRRIVTVQSGNIYKALVNNDTGTQPKECFISSQSAIQTPSVTKINYNNANIGYFNNLGILGLDSAYIIITHKSLWSEALSYYNYRNTHAPNIGRVALVDIDELYDQFAFGIQKHPLSIKNFSDYVLDTWPSEAQHIFLIGKSISPADFRNDPALFSTCAVASYGVPTSDLLLTTGIHGAKWEPKIPIGRLSAQSGSDVNNYLNKVIEYEDALTSSPKPWQKEILHFGGGNNLQQQAQLAGYLQGFENIMEDSLFGGHVTTYLKYSNDPIQINLSDSLQAQIDSGVAIMTFFGHASGSGFDASTDEPSEYRNRGRYPLVVANSCFAGDFHTTQKSVSEKFVLEPEKAAIGFIASVGLGEASYLNVYSQAFFEQASYYSYGATFGQLMKRAIQVIQTSNGEGEKRVSNEMSLQGDPSLRIYNFEKPDYAVDESGVHLSPSTITTDLDTFSVIIEIKNQGRAVQDSFFVKVIHTYPDGIDSVYNFKTGRCYYSTEFRVKLHSRGVTGAGLNKIHVEIDLPDSVDEYDNNFNNITYSDFFIYSKDVIPVYPPDYAIHPYNTVTLKASTANPMAGMANYIFEIDTIDLNLKDRTPGMQPSPLFRFTTVSDSGGVLSWNPPNYILGDSVVYFWRVANDSIQYDTANFHWQQSSFMYIPGKTGWAQSHFHQFKNDNYENVLYDTLGREFRFVNNNKTLRIETMGTPSTQTQYNIIGYYLNNSPIEYNGCQTTPAIMVAVLDSISLEPWTNCAYNFGQANWFTLSAGTCSNQPQGSGNCRSRPENYFIFHLGNPVMMDSLQSMLNSVPTGNYIVMYSWFTFPYSTASPSLFSALTSVGFNTGLLQDNMPFTYFVRKNFLGTNQELHGNNQSDSLSMQVLLQNTWNRGNINSVTIGPASRWESLHWNQHPKESLPYEDIVFVNVYGQNSTTNFWDTLAMGIQYTTGKDTTLSWIQASQYPYLKLQSYVQDDSLRTPAQMIYWRVYHDEVPECALNPNKGYSLISNPLQEGDTLRMSVAIENISNLPMDSLGVSFYMYDEKRKRHDLKLYKLDSLLMNELLMAEIVIDSTFGFAGENSLWVEANPYDSGFHQPEKHHFNNLAEVKFKIQRDVINPILDVTFDGVHILNGDIISGKPLVVIQLHDENQFLALNDTSKFNVYMTTPSSNVPIKLEWDIPVFGQTMRFTPAVLPKNSCRIDWNPILTEDGTYQLEVEAADITNNESGKYNYKISFEVINKSTITEVLNYPNPFSTSTRFVFTLTGSEIPTGMKIQIMTITGKIVREIFQHELGNIHIGRNITDYAWDGKDEFGDQLANGLYLYRVTTELNAQAIEHRETEVDKYFKKGWGKMYLMR